MTAKLSSGTSIDGVAAYQDHSNPQQFHYFPLRADCILGDTLVNFDVSYWGINPAPYYVDLGGGNIVSSVGGILAGRARMDISASQRRKIVNAIKNEFGIPNPRLLPFRLSNIQVEPVIASNVIELTPQSSVTFPSILQLGTTFAYNVSANNSLFATLAAGVSNTPSPRPSFAINVYGDVEYVGDPWKARIRCDLSQVWKYTRTYVSASVKWGWFTIGSAEYEKIVQELVRSQIITIDYEQGSGDPKFGRQLLESAKVLFDRINQQAISGEGFFKFEPNPDATGGGSGGGGNSWLPWSVSINGSYTSKSFSQSIQFDQTISYTGRVKVPMSSSMVLAVGCGSGTSQYFHDFQDSSNGCLTQAKLNGLQQRLTEEVNWKQMKALQYLQNLENGVWTAQKYREMMAILREFSYHEVIHATPHGMYRIPPEQVDAELANYESAFCPVPSFSMSGTAHSASNGNLQQAEAMADVDDYQEVVNEDAIQVSQE